MTGIISGNKTIHAVVNGKAYAIAPDNANYPRALQAFKKRNGPAFVEAVDFSLTIKAKSDNKITLEDGALRYNGAIIQNSLATRILRMLSEGFDCKPIVAFMERCFENPNPTVIDRLYGFLENNCIMLDQDGYIVGYKKVRDDGLDFYTGTVLYEVGKVVTMSHEQCNWDTRVECGAGLHIGSKEYAEKLWHPGRGKVLLLRVNPKDVVCVPESGGMQKLRASEVYVLTEYKPESHIASVYEVKPEVKRDRNGRFAKKAQAAKAANKAGQKGPKRDSCGRFC